MKVRLIVWLEKDEIKRLQSKAKESGFDGKGAVSHYLERIANESVIFISKDVKAILEMKQ